MRLWVTALLVLAFGVTALTTRPSVSWFASRYPYPESWTQVKTDMTSSQIRALLGAPQADGTGLKTVDRWHQNHDLTELHLDVFFETGWQDENDHVIAIHRWKRFLGHTVEEFRINKPSPF